MPARDITYNSAGMDMRGYFASPQRSGPHPGILLVHGAHGLDGFIIGVAERLSALGYAVLALDMWGERRHPTGPAEIGGYLRACTDDRPAWMTRVRAAHEVLTSQPEADAARTGALGYCFGGSTVLEYVRHGGLLAGAVSFHAGLDVVADSWDAAGRSRVLICTGAEDPMAKPSDLQRVTNSMTTAGISWEADIYGGARHAFTEPDAAGRPPFARYDEKADHRSWAAMSNFFAAVFA